MGMKVDHRVHQGIDCGRTRAAPGTAGSRSIARPVRAKSKRQAISGKDIERPMQIDVSIGFGIVVGGLLAGMVMLTVAIRSPDPPPSGRHVPAVVAADRPAGRYRCSGAAPARVKPVTQGHALQQQGRHPRAQRRQYAIKQCVLSCALRWPVGHQGFQHAGEQRSQIRTRLPRMGQRQRQQSVPLQLPDLLAGRQCRPFARRRWQSQQVEQCAAGGLRARIAPRHADSGWRKTRMSLVTRPRRNRLKRTAGERAAQGKQPR